ncbi:MAG: hypothetical protein KGL95_06395 [Patescibacteria group bacterium]|nr:hypothetical protein [Patescibacteria group bacterium]
MITSFTTIIMATGGEMSGVRSRLSLGSDIPVNAPHKRTAKPHRRETPATPPQRRIPEPVPTRRTPEPVRTAPLVPVPARRESVPA